MPSNLIGAIDFGSSKIKILIVRKKGKDLELVNLQEKVSEGIKKGIIVDTGRVSRLLNFSLKEVEKKPPFFVGVAGAHLFSLYSHGVISISRADQVISEEEKERVIKAAETINLGLNKEVLFSIPQEFIIDGERGIQDPVGLKGLRLETEALILGGFSQYIENIKKVIFYSDLEAQALIPSPLAVGRAVLKEREKELGICLLNLGAETTEISFFKNGKLNFFQVIPIGASFLTNKISLYLRVDFDTAERIKIEFGACFAKAKKQRIEIAEGEKITFTESGLSKVIRDSLSKILSEIKKVIKEKTKNEDFPAGIVITGGGAKLKGICDFFRQKLKLHTRLGIPNGISGLEPDPALSLVAGVLLEGMEIEGEIKKETFFKRLKEFFKNFLP